MRLSLESLEAAQEEVAAQIDTAIGEELVRSDLGYADLKEAAFAYLRRGGKRLRPLLVLLSAGAAGGDPKRARSLALAVEIFHTWTLIHDDLIDNDELRRGGATVHAAFTERLLASGVTEYRARGYGQAVAILAGDYLQGMSVRLVLDAARVDGVSLATVQRAAELMQTEVVRDLVEGEIRDVAFTNRALDDVSESELLDAYRQKSATLIAYCARVGAMFGLDDPDPGAQWPATLAAFAESAGIAFQIRDDVLGLIGTESRLGKPVGSDIREGKRTPILVAAYAAAGPDDRALIDAVVGVSGVSDRVVGELIARLDALGGLEHARRLAESHVHQALAVLDRLPESHHRSLLRAWALHLVSRES